jgi:outer membrane receptor protein involved in Fe transport
MQGKINTLKSIPAFSAGVFFFFLVFPSIAFAQTDTAKKLKEVKVSTSPIPQVQTIAPSQQISASDFEHYSAFNVADAIRNFSGVNIKDYGGIGGLKTISVRGLGANHTAVLYDGVQLNDAENGQVDLSKFNLQNVQEITLYNGQPPNICQPARSFSAASVLSIKTIKPVLSADKPYLITAGIKGGSFGLFNPNLLWQQRIGNNWSFVINSYLENANGRYKYKNQGDGSDSVHRRTGADISAQQIDGALYWAKNDSNKFKLHINYYNSDRGLPGAVIDYTVAQPSRLWNQDLFVQTGYERIWNNGFHLLVNAKLSKDYLHYFSHLLNTEGIIDQHFTQREAYLSTTLAYSITHNWEVSYAVDASLNDLNTQYNLVPATPFPYPTRFILLNVLASNYTIGKLHLQGSLLNTNTVESVKIGKAAPNKNIYSPTLMASIQPFESSNFQLRGFYKSIFRNLTFNDLYYEPVVNPNLKPEFAKEFDLGATYTKGLNSFFNYITLTVDAYYNNVTNKIVFIPHDPFSSSVTNAGKVDIKGLDAGLKSQANLAQGWKGSLSINYTYQQAINVTDPIDSYYLNQIPYTPKNTLALNAGIDHGHLGIYYNQVLSSQRYYNNNNISGDKIANDNLPGYSISDASIVYRFLTKHTPVMASFEVNNIFNKYYSVIRSYPMPGRSYRISLQITI